MKKKKLKIEIEVWGIEVEETSHYQDGTGCGWFNFEYSFRINGGKKKYGEDDGSWSNQTRTHFRRMLGRGYAEARVVAKVYDL